MKTKALTIGLVTAMLAICLMAFAAMPVSAAGVGVSVIGTDVQSGGPGTTLSYTLNVSNTGPATSGYLHIAYKDESSSVWIADDSPPDWPAALNITGPPYAFSIGASTYTHVYFNVTIPSGADEGEGYDYMVGFTTSPAETKSLSDAETVSALVQPTHGVIATCANPTHADVVAGATTVYAIAVYNSGTYDDEDYTLSASRVTSNTSHNSSTYYDMAFYENPLMTGDPVTQMSIAQAKATKMIFLAVTTYDYGQIDDWCNVTVNVTNLASTSVYDTIDTYTKIGVSTRGVDVTVVDDGVVNLSPGGYANYKFTVQNTGNKTSNILMFVTASAYNPSAVLDNTRLSKWSYNVTTAVNGPDPLITETGPENGFESNYTASQTKTYYVNIGAPSLALGEANESIKIIITAVVLEDASKYETTSDYAGANLTSDYGSTAGNRTGAEEEPEIWETATFWLVVGIAVVVIAVAWVGIKKMKKQPGSR